MMNNRAEATRSGRWVWLRAIGPAIIVASVVLGPGSILASSRVGAEHGYPLIWVLVLSCGLMMGMVTLGTRLGVGLRATPCAELARRLGRPVAWVVAGTVFLIIVCFQVGNNMAVLAVLQRGSSQGSVGRIVALVGLNGLALAGLYGFRQVYRSVERLMLALVLLMIVGFAGNLLFTRPDWVATLKGLVPQLPENLWQGGMLPIRVGDGVVDPLGALPALIATTLSVAGAFYQAYLVKEKGWGPSDRRRGTIDTVVGIAVLGGISLMILLTSAAVLHGKVSASELRTTGDIGRQLEPLFGSAALWLFNAGLFAAAFSSFLVNALIGGAVLADGLGRESSMGGAASKRYTGIVLVGSMAMAIGVESTGVGLVGIILFAQALTVLGLPALVAAMLYLGSRPDLRAHGLVPGWLLGIGTVCLGVSVVLALRKAWELWLKLM